MRKILLSLSIALSLTGCAKLNQAYEVVTTSNVPPAAIDVAINSFDVAKVTGKNYIVYCTPNPAPVGCNDSVIRGKLMPAMKNGTNARNTLKAFLRDHPGALGPIGSYQLLTTSTAVINQIAGK